MSYFQDIGRMSAYDDNGEKETKGDNCSTKKVNADACYGDKVMTLDIDDVDDDELPVIYGIWDYKGHLLSSSGLLLHLLLLHHPGSFLLGLSSPFLLFLIDQ